jgi:hypothetical protein
MDTLRSYVGGGEIIPRRGVEIDSDRLTRGEEWTVRDFVP